LAQHRAHRVTWWGVQQQAHQLGQTHGGLPRGVFLAQGHEHLRSAAVFRGSAAGPASAPRQAWPCPGWRDGLHPEVVAPAGQSGEKRVVVAEPLRYPQTQRGEGDAVGVLTVGQPLALVDAIVDATHSEAVQVLATPPERRLQNAVQLCQGGRARHLELAPDQRADPSDHHPQAVDLPARPGGVWRAGIHLDLLRPSLLG
jgi:hypothetical protein